MEYAGSYALYNYRLVDPSLGLESPDNVRLIRAFERGLDPASSEAGFVLVHVDMARHSGKLVDGVTRCFGAFDIVHARRHDDDSSKGQSGAMAKLRNRAELRDGLAAIVAGLRDVDTAMETMWARSRPSNYAAFRTFIFGITAQSMFPDGVLYEGLDGGVDVREEEEEFEETVEGAAVPKRVAVQRTGKKLSFRGESGANDSMIPMLDNLLQITMPDTPLTRILADFRDYRPSNHRAYLAFVASQSVALDLRSVALGLDTCSAVTTKQPGDEEDPAVIYATRLLWLRLLDGVRRFRWRHWCFAREYILKPWPGTPAARHPTATGGSPIVQWLPNQLRAVVAEMDGAYADVASAAANSRDGEGNGGFGSTQAKAEVDDMMEAARRQADRLEKEVVKFCKERGIEHGQA